MILMEKKFLERFTKTNCKKQIKKNSFNSWIDKKDIVQMREYFQKPKSLWANVKVELDLSNYATKTDLRKATVVDTSCYVKKFDLAS